MTDWMDDRSPLGDQYADPENLNDRIALHRRYSTADRSFRAWQFDQFERDGLPADARVLGLGAGPGDLWADNRGRVPAAWDVVVTDRSRGMVEEARATLAGSDPAYRHALVDAAAVPFGDATFDAVTANHVLYHVPDRDRALGEMRRVLRPGGRLYAATNGEENMVEVMAVVEEVTGERPPRGSGFRLENGRAQLERHFDAVELRRFDEELVVTDIEPLVAYALSRNEADERLAPALRTAFAERFEGGVFRVTKAIGTFVARAGAATA